MKNEVERKFYVKELPDLSGIKSLHYERYILERGEGHEARISKIDDKYFYEFKKEISGLTRERNKDEITKEKFDELKRVSHEAIIRDRFNISTNPDIAIQIYHGRFEGLVRAEVEFDNEEEARNFRPLPWMGKEMTDLPIARDSRLLDLGDEEFRQYLL